MPTREGSSFLHFLMPRSDRRALSGSQKQHPRRPEHGKHMFMY